MTTLIDGFSLPITCPNCAHQFKRLLGVLKKDADFLCPGRCGTIFNPADFRVAANEMEKSLADFQRRRDVGSGFNGRDRVAGVHNSETSLS